MEDNAFIRAMFGQNAVQVPINFIMQDNDDPDIVSGVFQLKHPLGRNLRFGSKKTHVLALGDMVFRPHLVVETDAFRGHGITGLYTSGFADIDTWVRQGTILVDPGIRDLTREPAARRRY